MRREIPGGREARKLLGICTRCFDAAEDGKTLCPAHAEANRQKTRSYYAAMPVEKRRETWRRHMRDFIASGSPKSIAYVKRNNQRRHPYDKAKKAEYDRKRRLAKAATA